MAGLKRLVVSLVLMFVLVGIFISIGSTPVCAMTGSGTEGDPYVIYNITDLQDMDLDVTAYYVLNNSIDASNTRTWNGGAGFDPVGTLASKFSGNFNGNGHTISGLHIDRPGEDYVGLFGYVDGSIGSNAVISNVTLLHANITGDQWVGVLIGYVQEYADISYCICGDPRYEATCCNLTATEEAGGLTSYIGTGVTVYRCLTYIDGYVSVNKLGGFIDWTDHGTVSECASYGEVSSKGFVGGFCDSAGSATIHDSYARVDVTIRSTIAKPQHNGGFKGTGGTSVLRSYSTGDVDCQDVDGCTTTGGFSGQSGCTNCFWDTQTSGMATSSCGTGKTTAQMKTESTFTSVGWDFDDVWGITSYVNDGYPFLLWFGWEWDEPPPPDNDDEEPLNSPVPDTNSTWVITIPYFDYYKEWVIGDLEVWYQPTIMINTPLPDQSGNGQTGNISWGISIGTIGGVLPVDPPIPPDVDPPDILPPAPGIPTDETSGCTGCGLPLYYSFLAAANSYDWGVCPMYSVMFIIFAIAVGVAGILALNTGWGFTIGFGSTMLLFSRVRDCNDILVMPGFILVFSIIVAILLGYIWART